MENAERKKLLDYIKTVIDLETEITTQEQLLSQCDTQWESRKPELELLELPLEPILEYEPGTLLGQPDYSGRLVLILLWGLIGVVLMLAGFATVFLSPAALMLIIPGFGCIVGDIVYARAPRKAKKAADNRNNVKLQHYQNILSTVTEQNKKTK